MDERSGCQYTQEFKMDNRDCIAMATAVLLSGVLIFHSIVRI